MVIYIVTSHFAQELYWSFSLIQVFIGLKKNMLWALELQVQWVYLGSILDSARGSFLSSEALSTYAKQAQIVTATARPSYNLGPIS